MQPHRPDRIVKALTGIVSSAFFFLLAMFVLLLAGSLAVRLFGGADPNWTWSIRLPATEAHSPTSVLTSWGPARLEVQDVQTTLRLPLGTLPWGVVAMLWAHVAVFGTLMLLALHNLRRILQRVRDGAPFDASNATRLRWLGLSLLGLSLNGVVELAIARTMTGDLPALASARSISMPVDGSLVFAALLLVALARIFHRGSDLEQDQSLVV